METNDTVDDLIETTSPKVVIGIRETPLFKQLFEQEAKDRGMTASEYGRVILQNRHGNKEEVERLTQIVNEQQKNIEMLRLQLAERGTKQVELFNSTREQQLLQEIEKLNQRLAFFSDQR